MDGASVHRLTTMIDRRRLEHELEEMLTRNAALFVEEVPSASHLTDDAPLDPGYYVRHRIETIKRIRGTAKTDALSLAAMVDEDYEAARLWSHYTAEELGHDVMFEEDLAAHGVTREEIEATPPFASTTAMLEYLTRQIAVLGSLPAVAYSLLVEWNSARYSGRAIAKARQTFGEDHVRRSSEHFSIDETEDHYSTMVEVAHRVLGARRYEPKVLFGLIDDIAELLRWYFVELHESTLAARQTAAAP